MRDAKVVLCGVFSFTCLVRSKMFLGTTRSKMFLAPTVGHTALMTSAKERTQLYLLCLTSSEKSFTRSYCKHTDHS